MAKGIVLGLLNGESEYGIQGDLWKAGINLSLDQIRLLVERFHEYFFGLKEWQKKVISESSEAGFAKTVIGRRKYLDKVIGEENATNKIRNFPITGTASDGFKIALCGLDQRFTELGIEAEIVLTMHDEIIVETKAEFAVKVQEIIQEYLAMAFQNIIPEMPFTIKAKGRRFMGVIRMVSSMSYMIWISKPICNEQIAEI